MATNLTCDDKLIEEARRVGRHKTKKDAVTAALVEYVQRRKRLRILGAFGTVDFDPKYDYKAERRQAGGTGRVQRSFASLRMTTTSCLVALLAGVRLNRLRSKAEGGVRPAWYASPMKTQGPSTALRFGRDDRVFSGHLES